MSRYLGDGARSALFFIRRFKPLSPAKITRHFTQTTNFLDVQIGAIFLIRTRKPGHFVWDIISDSVWCDEDLAKLLGLEPEDGRHGFPIARFMAKVHIDDMAFVASTMKRTLASGEPYDMTCRVVRNGVAIILRGRGRCYRQDEDGPTIASGIIEEITSTRTRNTS